MKIINLFISTIEIPVSDLQRAIQWYDRVLGYSNEWSDSHHAMLLSKNKDNSPRILLVETNDPTRLIFKSTNTNLIHSAIDFETDNLGIAHAHLSTYIPNLEPIPIPSNDWAPLGFGFSDSEGNRLAVFSYNHSKDDPSS